MRCPKCGSENAGGEGACTQCGFQPRPRIYWLAVVALVLGLLGLLCSVVATVQFLGSPELLISSAFLAELVLLEALLALPGLVLAIISWCVVRASRGTLKGRGIAVTAIWVSAVALFAEVYTYPFTVSIRDEVQPMCQSNLKELGTAILMYADDYDGVLPCSALFGGRKKWDAGAFTKFASDRGTLPPVANDPNKSWPEVLYPYIHNKDIIHCPSDPSDPYEEVSYYWKAAVDYAWFEGMKTEQDFGYPADQIIMYGHPDRHWNQDAGKGFANGVILNCLYVDGHVAAKKIANSGYGSMKKPGPLPPNGGEPAWYNWNIETDKTAVGKFWDPRKYADNLK